MCIRDSHITCFEKFIIIIIKEYGEIGNYKKFEGDFILQTMFIRGEFEGKQIDNTTKKEITAWLELVKEMNPREVMIYTIDRQTPAKKLKKVPLKDLKNIAEKVKQLGIKTNIAG